MKRENLPIWRILQQILLQVELVGKGFSRYHKYSIGAELRKSALQCWRLLVRLEHGFLKGGLKKRVLCGLKLKPRTTLINAPAH